MTKYLVHWKMMLLLVFLIIVMLSIASCATATVTAADNHQNAKAVLQMQTALEHALPQAIAMTPEIVVIKPTHMSVDPTTSPPSAAVQYISTLNRDDANAVRFAQKNGATSMLKTHANTAFAATILPTARAGI